ncbi:HAD-IIA family hydrolase [Nocardia sp. NPDC050712]|uniref:HAD-IIA family hydrolase n=1 Tax=Nocardia sp. NPDC050712 TaxID=3155518 RepID=UPI0034050A35
MTLLAAHERELLPGTAAPATVYDCAFLDLDGVVFIGTQPIEQAAEALAQARTLGMRLAFVSNNSLHPPADVADKLGDFEVAAQPGDVVTCSQALAEVLAGQYGRGARVLAIGGEGLTQALSEVGLHVVDSADDEPQAVAQGFGGPDMPFSRFTEACLAIRAGIPWYATNPDPTMLTDRGLGPGNGAAVELLCASTGQTPFVAGKPYSPIYDAALKRTGAKRPLCVGDRLDTDIAAGYRNGADSLLVLTGITDPEQLVAAPPDQRPTYIADNLHDGLLSSHPAVTRTGDNASRCNGWTARADTTVLDLYGEGSALDALRAVCHAAWTAAPRTPSTLTLTSALRAMSASREAKD